LANLLERIRARATWDSTDETDARPERLHHGAVETMGDGLEAQVLRVRGLHLILLEWLHFDDVFGGNTVITRNVFSHYSFVCWVMISRTRRTHTMGSMMIDDVTM